MPRMLALAIFMLAMNLRAPFLGVTPLLQMVKGDYGLDSSVAGLLTTLPLIVFALISPFIAGWSHRLGVGRTIIGALLIILAGELIRYVGGVNGLFGGTVILALGVTAGNVLIPALVRGFFPSKMGIMTSGYSALMQVTTTVTILIAVPVALKWGWQNMLVSLASFTLVALVCWWPFRQLTFDEQQQSGGSISLKAMFSQPLAWDVSLFMGIQSFVFYCLATWIPSVFITGGIAPVISGYLSFLFPAVSLVVTFVTPIISSRFREQKWLAVLSCMIYLVGICGVFLGHTMTVLIPAVVLTGAGAGATFGIALMYFVLRTESAGASAMLSGMGQAIGYVLAAVGPVLIGYLYDHSGSWLSSMYLLAGFCIAFAVTGYRSGRDMKIRE